MTRKRDYHKNLHDRNKNIKMKLRREKNTFKKKILKFFLLLFFVGLIYWLFFSFFWQIKKVSISGFESAEDLERAENLTYDYFDLKRFVLLSNQNYFIFNENGLANVLRANFNLSEIQVNKEIPDKLIIQVEKEMPKAFILAEGVQYPVFASGKIIESSEEYFGLDLPIFRFANDDDVFSVNKKIISHEQIKFVNKIYDLFSFYFKDVNLDYFEAGSIESGEVKLVTQPGWYVMFSAKENPEEVIQILKRFYTEKIKNKTQIEYIDLRIKDKIFYK